MDSSTFDPGHYGSFKADYRYRRFDYRTPSPPRRLVESISPVPTSFFDKYESPSLDHDGRKRKLGAYHEHLPQDSRPSKLPYISSFAQRNQRSSRAPPAPIQPQLNTDVRSPPSALDVFAAVATSPSVTYAPDLDRPAQHLAYPQSQIPFERHSKRSRSELVGYRPAILDQIRPTTSSGPARDWRERDLRASLGEQVPDGYNHLPPAHTADADNMSVLERDAELLLSFARGSVSNTPLKRSSYGFKDEEGLGSRFESNTWPMQQAPSNFHQSIPPNNLSSAELRLSNGIWAIPSDYDGMGVNGLPTKPREHRGWPKGKPRGPRKEPHKRKTETKKQGSRNMNSARQPRGSGKNARKSEIAQQSIADEVLFQVPEHIRKPRRKSISSFVSIVEPDPSGSPIPVRSMSAPPSLAIRRESKRSGPKRAGAGSSGSRKERAPEVCPTCGKHDGAQGHEDLWISCNGCKRWFHCACAGFPTEAKVKEVDKYHCESCRPMRGPTTFVRKSSRAHASVDYAGLNEGKIRTAVDVPDHHYIQPIKDGEIRFQPESFARLPPELVNADYFTRGEGWTEPVLIPAALNPRPRQPPELSVQSSPPTQEPSSLNDGETHENFRQELEYDCVIDDGQDKLDMVIPSGLTVRRAAELYGPDERVDVIDVKLQEGEDRRWTMRQWADYYEAEGEKPVRNVISLEVSQSRLGRLIRRPKLVRDLDLQDSVWPEEETSKGVFPRVQFYCLMSVADCYTDFHIDFGGSSVYYHILKGRKTFFFIPPKPKYLKKYEDWCNSPDQNSVFLGNETKECYRVDLFPGDTMLIPSGWIHAVWTPENSLVIGGNFLTRMHYGMQIAVNEIEKATNVTRKFRYPHFQKILWLAVIQYLQQDPIPSTVVEMLSEGRQFERSKPVWVEFDPEEQASEEEHELYNYRYYSQGEIEGLPDLVRFVYRTVMVVNGRVPGVAKSTQEAVMRSMPKGCGDHLDVIKVFAMWTAWKRGNEQIPSWAHPDAPLAEMEVTAGEKRVSANAQKRLERQAAHDAYKLAGDRRSLRPSKENDTVIENEAATEDSKAIPSRVADLQADQAKNEAEGHRACETCRKKRRRCTHNGPEDLVPEAKPVLSFGVKKIASPSPGLVAEEQGSADSPKVSVKHEADGPAAHMPEQRSGPSNFVGVIIETSNPPDHSTTETSDVAMAAEDQGPLRTIEKVLIENPSDQASQSGSKRSKSKACIDCKRSKRRCIHNELGQIDPVKAQESPIPRGPTLKRPRPDEMNGLGDKKIKLDPEAVTTSAVVVEDIENDLRDNGGELNHAAQANSMPSERLDEDANQTNGVGHGSTSVARGARGVALNGQPKSGSPRAAEVDSRSRTPSLHMQLASSESVEASNSPAMSPVTDMDAASPATGVDRTVTKHEGSQQTRTTPRQRKQVDRYSDVTPTSNKSGEGRSGSRRISGAAMSPPVGFAKPNSSGSGSKKRSASRSVSQSPGLANGTGARPSNMTRKSPSQPRILTETEKEEDESLRLAKLLAGEDYGLRRRANGL